MQKESWSCHEEKLDIKEQKLLNDIQSPLPRTFIVLNGSSFAVSCCS